MFAMASYAEISRALDQLGVDEDAAEHHGTLCGLLCVDNGIGYEASFAPRPRAATAPGAVAQPAAETIARDPTLEALHDETLRQLRDPELSFHPLLPDDDLPLAGRMDALTNWCKGFLYGLGAAGFQHFDRLPDEIKEFMQDLIDITRTNPEAVAEDEEEESAYAEIVEYLRIGVLLLHAELQRFNSGLEPDEPVLH